MDFRTLKSSPLVAVMFIWLILIGNLWAGLALTGQIVPGWFQDIAKFSGVLTVPAIGLFLLEWTWVSFSSHQE